MIVFLHGVPETYELWDELRAHLDAPSVALALPGFGKGVPEGFTATQDAYVEWVLAQLSSWDEPIDLVGHDWGGIIACRIATSAGTQLRSWASDAVGILREDYVWHDLAQIWRTPNDGEAFWENQIVTPVEDRAAVFTMLGASTHAASRMAAALDPTMASCILRLYRSSDPNPAAAWRPSLGPTRSPGLVIIPTDDPFGDEAHARSLAESLHARVGLLPGLGHWWASQDPNAAADMLTSFWSSLD